MNQLTTHPTKPSNPPSNQTNDSPSTQNNNQSTHHPSCQPIHHPSNHLITQTTKPSTTRQAIQLNQQPINSPTIQPNHQLTKPPANQTLFRPMTLSQFLYFISGVMQSDKVSFTLCSWQNFTLPIIFIFMPPPKVICRTCSFSSVPIMLSNRLFEHSSAP